MIVYQTSSHSHNRKVTYPYADPLYLQNNQICQSIYNTLSKSKIMAIKRYAT